MRKPPNTLTRRAVSPSGTLDCAAADADCAALDGYIQGRAATCRDTAALAPVRCCAEAGAVFLAPGHPVVWRRVPTGPAVVKSACVCLLLQAADTCDAAAPPASGAPSCAAGCSVATCERLGWPLDNPTAPGNTVDVCGESDSWGGGAPGTASEGDAGGCREGTWSEAQAACAEIGARLCTADEACPR
jgi:hypothetical protein